MIVFREPTYLWLLLIPALLLLLWAWRFWTRRSDVRLLLARRVVPSRQQFGFAGDLPFWLCMILASAALIVAAARPAAPTTVLRRAGIDVIVLQDASASMRVQDVPGGGDRWGRSVRFLRLLGDALSWREDRIALAVFAHIATPQIRLTKDPNTLFFFLDHLEQNTPFRLEDVTTWDTNLEQGLYWGIRLVEKDAELHGRSQNAKLFVMLSDGETWSGEVAKSLALAADHGIPVFVIGVGTLTGGRMPVVPSLDQNTAPEDMPPLISRLDRAALQRIAVAGRGRYFELDRNPDRDVANAIVDTGRRLAPALGAVQEHTDWYWSVLAGAAIVAGIGLLFISEIAPLGVLLAGLAVTAALLQPVLW